MSYPAGVKELIIITFHLHKPYQTQCTYYLARAVTAPFVYIVIQHAVLHAISVTYLTHSASPVSASQQTHFDFCSQASKRYQC